MLSLVDTVCLVSIVIFGVPHGAFDYAFLRKSAKGRNGAFIMTIAVYVLLIFLSLILWFLAPTLSLILFLLISTYHFGVADPLRFCIDPQSSKILAISSILTQGGLTTILLPLFHWATVSQYFTVLQSNPETLFLWLTLSGSLWVISGLVVFKHLFEANQTAKVAATLLACLLVYLMKPLLFFAVFFCCFHSWSHYKNSVRHISVADQSSSVSFFITTILAWALIVIVGLGFLPIFGDELTFASEPSLLRGVFATLFALTVPHIVVVDFLVAPKDRSELMDLDRSEFTT